MQIRTIAIRNINNTCEEVTVIGRIFEDNLIDASGNLFIKDLKNYNFKDNDIVVLKLLITDDNLWKIKEIIFHSSTLTEVPENIWRLSSTRADTDHNHWKLLHFRHKTIQMIRNYYLTEGFIEIETPILRLWEDATDNNLFVTTIGSRNFPRIHLRSCPEEYTRRAVIPFLRTFEIGKSFRNENSYRKTSNIQTYLPEFTLIEFYETPADFENGMLRLEEVILKVLKCLNLPNQLEFNNNKVSFKTPFKRLRVLDAINLFGGEEGKTFIGNMYDTKYDKQTLFKELNCIIEKKIKPNLVNPTFITHFPREADVFPDISDNGFVLRAELICGGIEIGEVGTLQSDSQLLHNHLEKAILERHLSTYAIDHLLDKDFIVELKRKIPHIGGGGLCIDRLVMLLTNTLDISDVVWYPFPLMKT